MSPSFPRHETYGPLLEGKTPGRCFLNETIATADVTYPILDVGGGHDNGYHRRLDVNHDRVVTLNLPRADGVDVYADAGHQFPFEDESFGTVFAFNLLEHLPSHETTIAECHRVLEPGGKCFVGVPFLHCIHGDPHDYVRFTDQRLRRLFSAFSTVAVSSLDEGPVSAAASLLFPVFQNDLVQYTAWRLANAADAIIDRYAAATGRSGVFDGRYPLFYFLVAEK